MGTERRPSGLGGTHVPWRLLAEKPAWPLPDTEWKSYYLHADGSLRLEAPRQNVAPTTYLDPDDTVDHRRLFLHEPVFEPAATINPNDEDF